MTTDFRLNELLDQWEAAVESGVSLTPAALCRDYPELLESLKEKIQAKKTESEFRHALQATPVAGETKQNFEKKLVPTSVKFETSFVDLQVHDQGGIGIVYRAVDESLNRNVAIKFIHQRHTGKENLVKRFRQEAEITGRLDHPGVVPVYALGQTDSGQPFYSMRFIRGDSLNKAIFRFHQQADSPAGQRPPPKKNVTDAAVARREMRKLLGHFVSVCRTVAYAHTRGIVHRDLKPQNIMLGKYGETLVVDWGLALPIDRDARFKVSDETTLRPELEKSIRSNSHEGTPVYMSPEQVTGNSPILPASDIFSLGVTLYKLLTGKLAFDGDTPLEVRNRIMQGDFAKPRTHNRSLAPALESIVLKSMSLEPRDRYETASELADDIENWLADSPVAAHRETWLESFGRWARHHRAFVRGMAASLLTLSLAALIGALFFFVTTRNQLTLQGNAERAVQMAGRSQLDNVKLTGQLISQALGAHLESRMTTLEEAASTPQLLELFSQENLWEHRAAIEAVLESVRTAQTPETDVVSWFALDRQGKLIARSSSDFSVVALNQPRSWRPYFHGGDFDLAHDVASQQIPEPIQQTAFSPVFTDSALEIPLLCISVPILKPLNFGKSETQGDDKSVLGVVGITLDINQLEPLQHLNLRSPERFVSLVECRGELAGRQVYYWGQIESGKNSDPNTSLKNAGLTNANLKSNQPIEPELLTVLTRLSPDQPPLRLKQWNDPKHSQEDWIAFAFPISVRSRIFGDVNCGWRLLVQDKPFK